MSRDVYGLDGLDLNKQGNIIKMKAWWYNTAMQLPSVSPSFLSGNVDYFPELVSTKITNTQGFIYTFSDFSLNLSRSQVSNWDKIQPSNPIQNPLQPIEINRFVDAQKLTTIFDPISDSSVYFDYNLPNDQNEFTISKGVFRLDGTIGSKNVQEITHKKRKLKKIRFDAGEIAFFYEFTRLDLPDFSENIALDNKALSKIVVKDIYGNIIKDIRFVYSNVRSLENCSEPECYRLILDEIYFSDTNNEEIIPGHKFEYNTRKLPKRNSWVSDFLGFHNGEVAAPEPTILGHYVPKTYHYPNQGKHSFLPFDVGNSNYTQLNGNFSLASNTTYAKAALLEKIIYPTGGYTVLEIANFESETEIQQNIHTEKDCLQGILKNLPKKYRDPLFLSDIKGLKQQEIANQLQQNLATTKSQIQRARKLIAQGFMDCCGFVMNKDGNLVGEIQDKEDCTICR
jgi:hypothetical protein